MATKKDKDLMYYTEPVQLRCASGGAFPVCLGVANEEGKYVLDYLIGRNPDIIESQWEDFKDEAACISALAAQSVDDLDIYDELAEKFYDEADSGLLESAIMVRKMMESMCH